MTRLALVAMREADRAEHRPAAQRDGRRPPARHVERPARAVSRAGRGEDGPHVEAGWSRCRRRGDRASRSTPTLLGSPTRERRNSDLAALLALGPLALPASWTDRRRARVRDCADGYGRGSVTLVASKPLRRVAPRRHAARRARDRAAARLAPGPQGAAARRGARLSQGKLLGERPLVAAQLDRAPGVGGRVGWYAGRTVDQRVGAVLVIVTVTMNAAVDRTLTVPSFQRRPSPPRERGAHARRRQGDQRRPRAEAPRRSCRRHRARGRAHRHAHRRRADSEAILNDFVRIADESRTSTAVVDPTTNTYTEINEWGPHVEPEELEMLFEKLALPLARRGGVVFAGSLPRGVEPGFYAEAIRDLNRRGVRACWTPKARRSGSASRPSRSSSRRTSGRPRASSGRSSTRRRTSSWRSTRSPSWERATC